MRRGNTGPPLIFIHGAGGSARHWGLLLEPLATVAQLYALDLPGHGRSPTGGPVSIAGYAQTVVAFHTALALPPALIVGHSMGGAIALHLAVHAPQIVAGLGLVGSAARLRVAPALLSGLAGDGPARSAAIAMLVDWLFSPGADPNLRDEAAAEYAALDPALLLADLQACDGFDIRPQLASIRCPALVVTGSDDRLTPPKLGAELAAGLGVAHQLLPGVGHMPMLEAPDRLSELLRSFIIALA
ncbi:alpha/beta fold hydrolase [Chloroflexus sp.]|uniref:alpha/beta fold hydrolase n=1 Tax=Chloroflexus sp. TaxID=1904827 RepID=UPI0026266602|nr:alpha/beta fold hydrolase [uncultured Chloroflexus sp.]